MTAFPVSYTHLDVYKRQTVTFAVKKPGLLFYPGRQLAGQVVVADIGLEAPADAWIELERGDAAELLPPREPDSHKGTYGHLAV